MDFIRFIKGLGHRIGQAVGFVASHVTDDQVKSAIVLVEEAEDKFAENALRRDYVVAALQRIPGVNENLARMLCEMAVGMVKKQLHKVTENAVPAA